MPVFTGAALAGGALVMVAGIFFLGSSKKKKKKGSDRKTPWTDPIWVPTNDEDGKILQDVCCIRGPEVAAMNLSPAAAREKLAALIFADVWPGVPWPVIAADHSSVQQVAAIIYNLVDSYYTRGHEAFCTAPAPTPDPEPTPDPDPDDPDDDIVKPEDFPTDTDVDPYPTPGAYYQVMSGDFFLGEDTDNSIVWRTLASLGYMAAKSQGMTDAEANAAAASVANNNQMRARYRNLIQCSPENDIRYGTYGYKAGVSLPSSHGRAIRLLAVHNNHLQNLKDFTPMVRRISMGTKATAGDGSGAATQGKFELLWLPAVDFDRVLAGGSADERLVPISRPDGSSGMNPPKAYRDLVSFAGVPAGIYGCAPWTVTVP